MSIEILYIECKASIILSVASWSTIATKMDASTCGRPSSLVREISYKMFSERDDDGTNLWRQIFSHCSLRYSYWTSTELHVPTLQRKFTSGSQGYLLFLILQQFPILPWLSRSPNLSPIECVGMFLDNACETLILPLASLRILNIRRTHCLVETHRPRWT